MKVILKCAVLLCLIVMLSSCSKDKKEWEGLQNLQADKTVVIQSNADLDFKIEACKTVIDSLNGFLGRYRSGEYINSAHEALSVWQQKRTAFNRQKDYQGLKTVQEASEQVLRTTADYDVRNQACENAIVSLQAFLTKYPAAEEASLVHTSLDAWKSRKSTLANELASLMNEFDSLSKEAATSAAFKQHALSNIEKIELENREKRTEGSGMFVRDVYAVRMRGKILGTSIFKLKITVEGTISMDTKKVTVNDKPLVEE